MEDSGNGGMIGPAADREMDGFGTTTTTEAEIFVFFVLLSSILLFRAAKDASEFSTVTSNNFWYFLISNFPSLMASTIRNGGGLFVSVGVRDDEELGLDVTKGIRGDLCLFNSLSFAFSWRRLSSICVTVII